MDPDACYDQMIAAEKDGDWLTAKEHAEDLTAWVDRGGFEPSAPNWRAFTANAMQRGRHAARRQTIAESSGIGLTSMN